MPPFKAILFDLDGTLVSTIDAYKEAVIETFNQENLPMTGETFDEWYSRPYHLDGMLAQFGLTEKDKPAIREERDRRYIELLGQRVQWLPGAKETLATLNDRPLGLVTGSHRSYVDAIDEGLHINQYFSAIVTADEMGRFMKPHPHGLLLAADKLNLEPKDCLYVGDQTFDLIAAKDAGMKSVLIPHDYTPKDAAEYADYVVKEIGEVLKIA